MARSEPPARPRQRAAIADGSAAERTLIGGVAVMLLGAAFAWITGPTGALAGLVTAAVWYGFGTPYAVAAAFVLLVGLFPGGIDRVSFATVAVPAVLLVLSAAVGARKRVRAIAGTLAVIVALGGFGLIALEVWSLWIAALGTLIALAVAVYGLHRYQLVRFGMVPADRTADRTGGGEST